jgi:hypothetical protein
LIFLHTTGKPADRTGLEAPAPRSAYSVILVRQKFFTEIHIGVIKCCRCQHQKTLLPTKKNQKKSITMQMGYLFIAPFSLPYAIFRTILAFHFYNSLFENYITG